MIQKSFARKPRIFIFFAHSETATGLLCLGTSEYGSISRLRGPLSVSAAPRSFGPTLEPCAMSQTRVSHVGTRGWGS